MANPPQQRRSPGRGSERELGTYQMLWDCKFCGTEKLLGVTHRFCPSCGAAQDPDTRYFPADSEKIAVEDHVYVGADLLCGSCGTANSGNSHNCRQCGAPLESAAQAATLSDQVRSANTAFDTSGPRDLHKERFEAEMQRVGVMPTPGASGGKRKWVLIGIGILVVAIIAIIAVSLLWTQETPVTVVAHRWEREIDIEAFEARSDNAWCDSMPRDAYNVTRRQEERSRERVPDGEECTVRRIDNGDGTFREREECQTRYREEPVYDDRCYFTVNRWGYERSVLASGASLNEAPAWPATQITRSGECLGCEREGNREARYLVDFQNTDGATYTCAFDEQQWRSMTAGSAWRLQISVVGNQPRCDAIEPAS